MSCLIWLGMYSNSPQKFTEADSRLSVPFDQTPAVFDSKHSTPVIIIAYGLIGKNNYSPNFR